jgi:penicillin-binding protein 1A
MPNPQKPDQTTKPKKKLSKKRLIMISTLAVLFIMVGIVVGVVFSMIAKVPEFTPQNLTKTDQTSVIYDKDNNQIGMLHAKENRELVEYKDIPDILKKSVVTVEDIRFYDHHGVDPIGIARALSKIVKGGETEGGSTITIQLARGAFLSPEQTLTRKIQEAYIAVELERRYTKDEILTFYLNRIFFGEGAYGIKAAAKTYFGKDITSKDEKDKLTLAEAALLTGLPQAPSRYDPYVNPEKAKFRRTVVLGVLLDNKVISQAEYDKAKDEPFAFVEKTKEANINPQAQNQPTVKVTYDFPYFVDYTLDELEKSGISEEAIFSGGLKIYTTVDSKIQKKMEAAYHEKKNFPADINGEPVESAMVIMNPNDGAIVAMVGGRNYRTARDFNRAYMAQRQPGSSAKPLAVYAPALEKGGYFEGTVLDDMPVSYKGGDGKTWKPTDFDTESSGYKGLITMREAIRNSVNIYAIKLLDKIGIDYAWQFAKDKFGLQLTERDKVLSFALGTESVSVLDMVSAYSAFPTGGIQAQRHGILKVVDSRGAVLIDNSNVEKKRILKEQTAYLINDMLRNVVTSGTGTKAQIGKWAVAGKTGTTSMQDDKKGVGLRDAWFVGYTPEYVGAVWLGLDNSQKNHLASNEYGGGRPALLWQQVMKVALEGKPVKTQYNKPSGISSIPFDTKSGLAPSSLTPSQFRSSALAIQGALPSGVSDVWTEMEVCADTGLLPGPNTKTKISKVFLNVNRSGIDPSYWPDDEAAYRPPTDVCTMGAATPPPPQPIPVTLLSNLSANQNKGVVTVDLDVSSPCDLNIVVTGPDFNSLTTFTCTEGKHYSILLPKKLPDQGKNDVQYTVTVSALDQTLPPVTLSY